MRSDKLKYVGGGWKGSSLSYRELSTPPSQDELNGAYKITPTRQ